ncbi:tRNA threonylcarbamoyladenosine biosynthesis protein TsaB [Roseibium hamelinense]|uniref:tRNA threonylcarbamoyladenosine biosynthesis protein TsaB n=1 Tax=Roseibium hamelinense TaxID=150831 RepID=A0A562T334_9HYPH|nr:tRNA (adenosine(37)-N6)-threonylcarbamoyltransferase complex dimerization subunit type 1 TsaB [Roseibium hamelinense]MTI44677.1 tRNA (adenosine(37)-N6)-threonylcarbamoyltransferase complex dimerization subunit type 1 TsaB [Roseibium hamelinense]TWI87306.1 tRNA threonylcarbamoyladenosine biosynthesis protein TsaB [Roseibium hamelinense]
MRVLALDTSLANCAAAVLDDGTEAACLVIRQEEIGRGHAEHLMVMIGDVMAEASTAFTDLDRIVVTTGPGSFTGLRVGLSVARGFGLVLGKPVVGITTLAAIARSAAVANPANLASIFVALPGKGAEVYGQLFDADAAPSGEPAVWRLDNLLDSLPSNVRLAGAAAADVGLACGLGPQAIILERAYPDIAEVARLGILAEPNEAAAAPLYLRPPDATPQTKGLIERLPEKAS